MDAITPSSSKRQQVMTFVMTIQYNGFAYAGFQRQSRTPTAPISTTTTVKKRKRKHSSIGQSQEAINSNNSSRETCGRKSKNTIVTVQDQIESALYKWTGLSLSTLRVRGAGRTDKGVHATHQVVAFDIPLLSLMIDGDYNNSKNEDVNCKEVGDVGGYQKISPHALHILQDAYQTFHTHISSKTEIRTAKPIIDQWKIRRAISTRLPTDIILRSIQIWMNQSTPFEARQNVASKTYIYRLRFRNIAYEVTTNTKSMGGQSNNKNVVTMHPICNAGPHLLRRLDDQNTIWLSPWPLDKEKLSQACKTFVGTHNFCNFVHKNERKESNGQSTRPSLVRRLERYKQSTTSHNEDDDNDEKDEEQKRKKGKYSMNLLEFNVQFQCDDELDESLPPIFDATFSLKAKGFHRSQVRNLVGFVVDVARGERSLDDARVLLMETSDNTDIGGNDDDKSLPIVNAAPASGLCLANVEYAHNDFL